MAPEPLNVNDPPRPSHLIDHVPDAGDWLDNAGRWLSDNAWWMVGLAALGFIGLLLYLWLSARTDTRRLKRDGLEILQRDLAAGARAYRVKGKQLHATGNAAIPPARLGNVKGFLRDVDSFWVFQHKPAMLSSLQRLIVFPGDCVSGLDGREIHLSIVGIRQHRGFQLGVPDVHDPEERAKWSQGLGRPITNATEFAEAWKAYMNRAVDSLLHFDGSLLALQTEHYLAEAVTYASWETGPDTIEVAKPATTNADAVGGAEPAR